MAYFEKSDSHGSRRFSWPTIIYCPKKADTEKVSQVLKEKGVENRIYHAGLPLSERKATHKAFVYDEVQVLLVSHLLANTRLKLH